MTRTSRRLQPTTTARRPRASAGLCLGAAWLALCGCTGQSGTPLPWVLLSTPVGPVPLNAPARAAGMQPQAAAPVRAVSRDGLYAGSAEVLSTGGNMCQSGIKVADFGVQGNSVRFGSFRGTISADGDLEMVYGQTWIIGQFAGATFHGQLAMPGMQGMPGCTYMLSLVRTGS